MNHRFTLEPYKGVKSRYVCPQCGLKQIFVRYIDTTTQQHLGAHVGRCNREVACGYHFKPKDFFNQNPDAKLLIPNTPLPIPKKKQPISQIPRSVFDETIQHYPDNHFVRFLNSRYGAAIAAAVVARYQVGTHHYWDGATVFWQVDAMGQIRTGKVMLYNPATGKRFRKPHNFINWMHTIADLQDFRLKQCLFGEHLLPTNTLPICIVESEKTAIIASIHRPQCLWLAAGSLSNLTAEKCKPIHGNPITLYPDLGAYNKWLTISRTIPNCTVSTELEHICTDIQRTEGWDLADYLLGMDKAA